MRRTITTWDAALVVLLVAANGAVLLRPKVPAEGVEILSDGEHRVLDLRQHRRLSVRGPLGSTVVEIGPAGAFVVASPCPNQICVRAGKVSARNPLVACLPNRVAIRLVPSPGGSETRKGVDAIAR